LAITFTSVPIGSTGAFLDGVDVSTAAGGTLLRETVVIADPSDGGAVAPVSSTTGLAVRISSSIPFYVAQSSAPWLVNGGISVSSQVQLGGTSQVFGTVSSQIVSSIPILVAQSTLPWTIAGTTSVNVINVPTVNVTNVPQVNLTTSIPMIVAQSTNPWTVAGQVSSFPTGQSSTFVANAPNVNVTNVPSVNLTTSIPLIVAQSTNPWTVGGQVSSFPISTTFVSISSSQPIIVAQSTNPWTINGGINISSQAAVSSSWPLSTTLVNIVSSLPMFVTQSSAPWVIVETASTAGGAGATTIALVANLNTTVIKASAGQIYGICGTNIGSSNVFVRAYNLSTAALAIASTAVPTLNFGLLSSTSPSTLFDLGVAFSSGITIITQQQPYTASSSVSPTASTATITIVFK
jgi:hypothetical protein